MAIKIENLDKLINHQLTIYSQKITNGIKEETKSAMKKLVKDSKKSAPVGKRNGVYRQHIASKTLTENANGIVMAWHVRKPEYALTHLLIRPHKTPAGNMTKGNEFLEKSVNEVAETYSENIEKIIKEG